MMNNAALKLRKVLRIPGVEQKTGMSRATIYNKLSPKSKYFDPTFPKPIRLGDAPTSAVGLIESELDEWIASRIEARDTPIGKTVRITQAAKPIADIERPLNTPNQMTTAKEAA
jgi:prophage regulatory protein